VTPYASPLDRTPVTLPCACGGFVTAKRTSPQFALLAHYRTQNHRLSEWGLSVQMNSMSTFLDPYAAHPERPTAGRSSRDVSGPTPRASAAPGGEPAA
jgi:hypothetical protein